LSYPLAVIALALASSFVVGPAVAGVASPVTSSVDSFAVFCPAGDLVFHVVPRDFAGSPEVDHDVDLDLCGCGAAVLCPVVDPGTYAIVGCRVRALNQDRFTGAIGYAVREGGACGGATLRVWSGGVLLRSLVGLASTDQDRDLVVSASDRAIVEAKIAAGTYDAAADLDGNRRLDAADLAVFDRHLGHRCEMAVPILPRSWGSVRVRYH